MSTTAKGVSALLLAALLSLALFLSPVGISSAQDDDTEDEPTEDTTDDTDDEADDERPGRLTEEEREELRAEAEARQQEFLDDVAAELGVTSEELVDAFQTVAIQRVEQKLADGDITQEQADELIERIESADGLGIGRFGFGGRGGFGGHHGPHGRMGGFGGDHGADDATDGGEI